MIKKAFHALLLFAVLCGTWLVFSGEDSELLYALGAASCALVTLLALRMNVVDNEGHPFHLLLTAPFYWLWLAKEMLKSGLNVTQHIWQPELSVTPRFVRVNINLSSDLSRTIYANSITLTPGTVCVDINDKYALAHGLDDNSIEDLKKGHIDKRVARLTTLFTRRNTH